MLYPDSICSQGGKDMDSASIAKGVFRASLSRHSLDSHVRFTEVSENDAVHYAKPWVHCPLYMRSAVHYHLKVVCAINVRSASNILHSNSPLRPSMTDTTN